uniref:Uncharacterized protein n=1 Tax=Thermogemmatispora argillosa TaxID=2045280 RepID=A0A455T5R2_9CHLR|nr:hypothetical protein KTA_21740 [Thermogemmatispora argillosa]
MRSKMLIDKGSFSSDQLWQAIRDDVLQAITSIQWPPGSGAFILYDEAGKRRREGGKSYFPLWEALGTLIAKGVLWIIAIEQDAVSRSVPRIAKGTDGRALM